MPDILEDAARIAKNLRRNAEDIVNVARAVSALQPGHLYLFPQTQAAGVFLGARAYGPDQYWSCPRASVRLHEMARWGDALDPNGDGTRTATFMDAVEPFTEIDPADLAGALSQYPDRAESRIFGLMEAALSRDTKAVETLARSNAGRLLVSAYPARFLTQKTCAYLVASARSQELRDTCATILQG